MRIAAFRAMRRANLDVRAVAARLAKDQDPGVRREVALSLRDQPAEKTLAILADLARGFDGKDRSYLEALGTGATRKEAALYDRLRREMGGTPTHSPGRRVRLVAWRLHVPAAVPLVTGPRSTNCPLRRKLALDTLAFVDARGLGGDAGDGRARQPAHGVGDVVAAQPLSTTGRITTCDRS